MYVEHAYVVNFKFDIELKTSGEAARCRVWQKKYDPAVHRKKPLFSTSPSKVKYKF